MAVNPLLSLQTQSLDLGQSAGRFAQAKQASDQQEQQQELIDLRKRGIELDEIKTALEERDAATQRRARNTALASLQLKRVLESGGTEAAMRFLQGSRESNEQLGFDSTETEEAMQLIESGDLGRLRTMLDNHIMVGEAMGVIDKPVQQETFAPVFDDEGNIVGQRSSLSGKVVKDPRAPDDSSLVDINVGEGGLTPGQKKVDEAFATEVFVPFFTAGGASDAQKNLDQLKGARESLEKSDALTGPIVGLAPDFVNAFVNPESVNVREAVEEVVQRNLREVLGAQFTEKEGERLISRAFNPKLSEERNIERLDRLIKAVEGAQKSKLEAVEYFRENGTLKGFRGSMPSLGSIESEAFVGLEDEEEDLGPRREETELQNLSDEDFLKRLRGDQ